jgi:V/A-type H+-transporting ATPase subunit I
VYYTSEKPKPTDETVPVLLKNNKFARLFEPIGKMYELPNYHEIDITPFFAPFYLLFFGLCLGDAGYGLLLLIGALIARNKVQPSFKPILTLGAVLGAMTVVCGTILGTLFGIELVKVEWAWLASFQQIMVSPDQMFNIALMLGGIQILFGMFIKAIGRVMRYGWAYSLETWGWIILLIGGGSWFYFGHQKGLLPQNISQILIYGVLGIWALFALILNTPGRNPIINFGAGLWNTYNAVTGLVGDVLSYIRLFALGLCGAVTGLVFNDLGMSMRPDIPVIGHLIMLVILLFGHSINIFMSGLGAFVHSLRLTFVEFYKNVGFQGRGRVYNPLKIH